MQRPNVSAWVPVDLREEWAALLERRPSFRSSLSICGRILEVWAVWTPARLRPLAWGADACIACWEGGRPLLAEGPPTMAADEVEGLLWAIMGCLAALGPEEAAALQRLAEAWDRGEVDPQALLQSPAATGGTLLADVGELSPELGGFVAYATLRPVLEAYFADVRRHLPDGVWALGTCPFCGAPPGFADLGEDGRRRPACHACGGAWAFSRVCCPCCSTRATGDLVRLQPGPAEEGYSIEACTRCGTYIKELDRRLRWNAGSALVEDWGSPHLDFLARRAGFRRPVPTLIELSRAA